MSDEVMSKERIMAMRPENLHKGAAGAASGTEGSDLDIEDMIEKSGCSSTYYELEECLGEHDRDWKKCQDEVKTLQRCNTLQQKLKASKSDKSKGSSSASP